MARNRTGASTVGGEHSWKGPFEQLFFVTIRSLYNTDFLLILRRKQQRKEKSNTGTWFKRKVTRALRRAILTYAKDDTTHHLKSKRGIRYASVPVAGRKGEPGRSPRRRRRDLGENQHFFGVWKTSGRIHKDESRKQDKFDFKPRNDAGYMTERAFTDVWLGK